MATEILTETLPASGATVVITHRILPGKEAEYERWLDVISPLCKASPGYLDWHIVRPIRGLTGTYTVIVRFDTEAHLRGWMDSQTRIRLIDQIHHVFDTGDNFFISSGLDFWFSPAGARVPVRWKQYLVTWSAIFPLVYAVSWLVRPVLNRLVGAVPAWLSTLVVTGIVVFLMVYVVMPRYTRLVHRWLFA